MSIEVPHNCGFLYYANVVSYLLFLLLLFWYVKSLRNSRVVAAVALLPMCFGHVQATCPTENTFFGIGLFLDLAIIVLLCLLKFKRIGLVVSFSTMLGRANADGGTSSIDDLGQAQIKAAVTLALALVAVNGVTNYYNRKFFDYLERHDILQDVPIEDRMSSFFLTGREVSDELRALMYVPWTLKSKILECLWKITGLHFAAPPNTTIYGTAVKEVVAKTFMPYEYERVLFYLSFNKTLSVDEVHMTLMDCPYKGEHPMDVICSHTTSGYASQLQFSMVDFELCDNERIEEAGDERAELVTDGTTTKDDIEVRKRALYSTQDIEQKNAAKAKFHSMEDITSSIRQAVQPMKVQRNGFRDMVTGRWVFKVADDVKRKFYRAASRCMILKKERINRYKDLDGPQAYLDVAVEEQHQINEFHAPTIFVNEGFVPPHFLSRERAPSSDEERMYAVVKFWVSQDPELEIFVTAGEVLYVPKGHQVCLTPLNITKYLVKGNELPELEVVHRNVQAPIFYNQPKENTPRISIIKSADGKWTMERGNIHQGAYATVWYNSLETG